MTTRATNRWDTRQRGSACVSALRVAPTARASHPHTDHDPPGCWFAGRAEALTGGRRLQTPNCDNVRNKLRSLVWFVLSTNPSLGPMVDLQDFTSSNPTNYSDIHAHSSSASVLINDPTMVVLAAEMSQYEDDAATGNPPDNHQFKVSAPLLGWRVGGSSEPHEWAAAVSRRRGETD